MLKTLRRISERLTVHRCPACGAVTRRAATLCPECLEKYAEERERRCPFCKMTAPVCVCSTRELYYCRELGRTMRSLLFYSIENPTAKRLITSLKYSYDREAEIFFARELSREILTLFAESGEAAKEWRVTYPPRRLRSILAHGKDHAKSIAKYVAVYTGMTFSPVLRHRGGKAQKTLGAVARTANAKKSYSLKPGADVKGGRFVIVDDVITSGATMSACQTILLKNGAKCAFALSVAKTPRRGEGADMMRSFRGRKIK